MALDAQALQQVAGTLGLPQGGASAELRQRILANASAGDGGWAKVGCEAALALEKRDGAPE